MAAPTNGTFTSGSLTLGSYLVVPPGQTSSMPGVILCHGFPIGPLDARQSALTFPQLLDRIASELGWVGLTFTFRGCGTSEGDFSMQGWVDDLRAAIDHMEKEANPNGIWLIGTNTGGALALCVAADDPRVKGCALLGPARPSRRLRRLGGAAAPLPGACPRDRCDPPAWIPVVVRRVEPRAAQVQADRRRAQVRSATVAGDARRGRRERPRGGLTGAGRGPRFCRDPHHRGGGAPSPPRPARGCRAVRLARPPASRFALGAVHQPHHR
ncbi:MAG: hypothetical protein RLZZ93_622 [Actinomycetota bacterium]